jgi:PleD family two-component response regulator
MLDHFAEMSACNVVMSTEQSQAAICKAFTVGAADYLIKPIRKNEVATLWHHIWRRVMAAGQSNCMC